MDMISVGEMVIDFLPGEAPGIYIRKAGGAPANAAIAACRAGMTTGFCGRVGADDFGVFLQETLAENQVAVLCPHRVKEATTTMAFVTLTADGDRSFTFARKPGADMFLTRDDVDKANVAQATIVHAGSCSLSKNPAADATVYAMEQGKQAGKLVSFDINYRNLLWDDDRQAATKEVEKILPLVDVLKISDEETDMLAPDGDVATAAAKYGIGLVVETRGAAGARCFWNGQVLEQPGRKAQCVDATGAGDAFWGGFLTSLIKAGVQSIGDLSAEKLLDALTYGNVAGWLCVQKKGAIESLPTGQEIDQILLEEAK